MWADTQLVDSLLDLQGLAVAHTMTELADVDRPARSTCNQVAHAAQEGVPLDDAVTLHAVTPTELHALLAVASRIQPVYWLCNEV